MNDERIEALAQEAVERLDDYIYTDLDGEEVTAYLDADAPLIIADAIRKATEELAAKLEECYVSRAGVQGAHLAVCHQRNELKAKLERREKLIEKALRTMSADAEGDISWDTIDKVFMSWIHGWEQKAEDALVRAEETEAKLEAAETDTARLGFKRLQTEVTEWHMRNFGPVESWKPLLIVVEEVGELSHAHMKAIQKIRTTEDHEANKKDAVGDIVIALSAYCSREGLDLQSCVQDTWERVRQRDWKANPEDGVTARQAEEARDG